MGGSWLGVSCDGGAGRTRLCGTSLSRAVGVSLDWRIVVFILVYTDLHCCLKSYTAFILYIYGGIGSLRFQFQFQLSRVPLWYSNRRQLD